MLITFVMLAALAYTCTATVSVLREAPRVAAALRPLLAGDEKAHRQREAGVATVSRAVLAASGVVGIAIGLLVPYLESGEPGWRPHDPSGWTPETAWHRILSPILGWFICRLLALMIGTSQRLSKLADELRSVDLLDPSQLSPFARFGLANTFWLTGLVAFASLMLLDAARYGGVIVFLVSITLVFAVGGLVLPIRGVHRRIRAAKQQELEHVNAALRGDATALAGTALAGRNAEVSVADLVAYRGLIDAVREWPIGAPTVFRFLLYLLIPVGSWAGGALVERVVDALLD